jgi:multiple sugar transport system permease protein
MKPMSSYELSRIKSSYVTIKQRFQNYEISPGAIFVFPVLFLIIALLIYPMLNTFWLSIQPDQGIGFTLQYYGKMLSSAWFGRVMWNSAIWVVLGVVGQISVGFGLALLLNTSFPRQKLVRGLYLLPWITPTVVVGLVFKWMYSPQFGIINWIFRWTGLMDNSIAWLSDPSLALPALVVAGLWKRFPFVMIMLLAGLQDVDKRLEQAAILDGAPYHARLRHVTLPQLMPVLKIVVLLSIIWCFNQFAIIFTATGGGPVGATETLPVKVYLLGFSNLQFNLSATLSVVMFTLMFIVMFVYIRILRKRGVEL